MSADRNCTRTVVPEMLAALMHAPRTPGELSTYANTSLQTVMRWIHVFHARGLIYRAGRVPRPMNDDGTLIGGVRPAVWALQPKPFERPDAD